MVKRMKKAKIEHLSEHTIQSQILEYLYKKGIFRWRANVGRKGYKKFGLKGQGDILGLTKQGIFFSIEVKDHRGKLSKEQIDFQYIIKQNNGIAIVARSLDDVIKII